MKPREIEERLPGLDAVSSADADRLPDAAIHPIRTGLEPIGIARADLRLLLHATQSDVAETKKAQKNFQVVLFEIPALRDKLNGSRHRTPSCAVVLG